METKLKLLTDEEAKELSNCGRKLTKEETDLLMHYLNVGMENILLGLMKEAARIWPESHKLTIH